MKLLIVICMVLFSVNQVPAQLVPNKSLEELHFLLQKSAPDTVRVQLLLQLSYSYLYKNQASRKELDSAFTFLQEAKNLNAEIHSDKWQNEILCYLGNYHLKTGHTLQANERFRKIATNIENSGDLNHQIDLWDELAFNIQVRDTIGLTRIDCLEKIGQLYQQLNDTMQVIMIQKDIADAHMMQGKFDLAESELLKVIDDYKSIGFQNLHYTYYLLSVTNSRKGDYNKALHYTLLSIESMENTGDILKALHFYAQLAKIYHDLGKTDKCIEAYRKFFEFNPPVPLDCYYVREAGIFVRELIKEKKEKEALDFILEFSKKNTPVDDFGKASLARTFAFCYYSLQNYPKANQYIQKMIELSKSLGKNNEITGDVAYDIGIYYMDKKEFSEATNHFQVALREAEHNHLANTIKDINLMLFKADSSMGNYLSAINHMNIYRALNDSIFNEIKNKQMEEIQAKYESEKKDQNILLLTEKGSLQQSKLHQANLIKNLTIGSSVLLLIIVGLIFNRYRLKQRINNKLEAQQKEINNQNHSLKHLLTEKEWLLKEIHHRVKNNLQIVMSLLNSQVVYLNNDAAIQAIRDSQHRVQAISLIHKKLYQSESVSAIDMPAYINELVKYLRDLFNTGRRIRFECQNDPVKLNVSHAVPLGLILNEAITNGIKFAFPENKAGVIKISLKHMRDEQYVMTIRDNGIGLSPNFESQQRKSLGMSLMEGLSTDIGGSFTIESEGGTAIVVAFVYKQITTNKDSFKNGMGIS